MIAGSSEPKSVPVTFTCNTPPSRIGRTIPSAEGSKASALAASATTTNTRPLAVREPPRLGEVNQPQRPPSSGRSRSRPKHSPPALNPGRGARAASGRRDRAPVRRNGPRAGRGCGNPYACRRAAPSIPSRTSRRDEAREPSRGLGAQVFSPVSGLWVRYRRFAVCTDAGGRAGRPAHLSSRRGSDLNSNWLPRVGRGSGARRLGRRLWRETRTAAPAPPMRRTIPRVKPAPMRASPHWKSVEGSIWVETAAGLNIE